MQELIVCMRLTIWQVSVSTLDRRVMQAELFSPPSPTPIAFQYPHWIEE